MKQEAARISRVLEAWMPAEAQRSRLDRGSEDLLLESLLHFKVA